MRISIWPDQSRPWVEIVRLVDHAEASGWDGVYVYDHFMPNTDDGEIVGGPVLEAWTTLTAIAARTSRVRLGTLVLGNLYRHPAVVARMAATLDRISEGRVVLGIGAGWQVNEHASFGIELTPPRQRLDQFEEACEVIVSMLRNETTDFDGDYYRIRSAPIEPRPIQSRLPVLIGAKGELRGLRVAARWGDEWNAWTTPESFRHKSELLDRYCIDIGRDPESIMRSTQAVIELTSQPSNDAVATPRRPFLRGTASQLADVIAEYEAAGVAEFIVPDDSDNPVEQQLELHDVLRTEVFAAFR